MNRQTEKQEAQPPTSRETKTRKKPNSFMYFKRVLASRTLLSFRESKSSTEGSHLEKVNAMEEVELLLEGAYTYTLNEWSLASFGMNKSE